MCVCARSSWRRSMNKPSSSSCFSSFSFYFSKPPSLLLFCSSFLLLKLALTFIPFFVFSSSFRSVSLPLTHTHTSSPRSFLLSVTAPVCFKRGCRYTEELQSAKYWCSRLMQYHLEIGRMTQSLFTLLI